jgi:hypothetical protein
MLIENPQRSYSYTVGRERSCLGYLRPSAVRAVHATAGRVHWGGGSELSCGVPSVTEFGGGAFFM